MRKTLSVSLEQDSCWKVKLLSSVEIDWRKSNMKPKASVTDSLV